MPPAKKPAAAAKPAAEKAAAKPAPKARPKGAPAGAAAKPKPRASAAKAGTKATAPKPKAAAPKPKAAASGAQRRPARTPAPAPEPTSAAARDEAMRQNLATLRDLLSSGVVITAQRLQEAVDDTVTRGRMTRHDAEDLMTSLVAEARTQTSDLLADLEQLLGRSASPVTSAASSARSSAKASGDRVLRNVDKARRAAKLGPSFPILGYDELTAAQVRRRLADLTPAQLRKVRDHERRNANRTSLLKAIEKALG